MTVTLGGITNPNVAPFANLSVFSKPDVTAVGQGGAWTTANTGLTLFTVTGTVLLRVTGSVTTLVTSTSNTGTLAVGITGTTNLFLPVTTADGSTNFILNSVWSDSTPTVKGKALAAGPNVGYLVSNANVLLAIATNNMTAGGMNLYAQWTPLTAGATVV